MEKVRVRFAPSPTGNVHIGNIRVCIYNWLFARNKGGKFLLRIEDTDKQRNTPEAISKLFEVLKWLRIDWDEEPVYQSKRFERHREMAEKLLKKGVAYYSDGGDPTKGKALYFKVYRDVEFEDIVLGKMKKAKEDMKDFVILKSDGTPVFHLANVVDDIDMEITHVLRGNDHVENTFRHILIYEALGYPPPKYAHFPMIVNQKGQPYSKRDGDAYVGDYIEKGYHPDALFNFLALCGWSPGDNREILSREEMIKLFQLEKVKKSPAQFDIQKMEWMNQKYLASMNNKELLEFLLPLFEKEGINIEKYSQEWWNEYISVHKDRIRNVKQLLEDSYYLFTSEIDIDKDAFEKIILKDKENVKIYLKDMIEILSKCEPFEISKLEELLKRYIEEKNVKFIKLAQPLRVALTGRKYSPGIFETLHLVGKKLSIERINNMLKLIENKNEQCSN